MQSWPGQAADYWKANWKRVLVLFIIEMVNLEEAGGGVVHKLRWPFANYWPSTYPRLTLLWWRNSFTVNLYTVDISSTTPTYLGLSMSFVNDPEVKGAPCGTTKLHTATYSSLTGPASWPQRPPSWLTVGFPCRHDVREATTNRGFESARQDKWSFSSCLRIRLSSSKTNERKPA